MTLEREETPLIEPRKVAGPLSTRCERQMEFLGWLVGMLDLYYTQWCVSEKWRKGSKSWMLRYQHLVMVVIGFGAWRR